VELLSILASRRGPVVADMGVTQPSITGNL
jgi:hypothetical protein